MFGKKMAAVGLSLAMVFGALAARAQEPAESCAGYVDFGASGIGAGLTPAVEAYIETPLLQLASAATMELVPEAGEIAGSVRLVQFKVFEGASKKDPEIGAKVAGFVKDLEADGWQMTFRVPEENVNVLMRTSDGRIAGLVLLIAESNDVVLGNLAGDLDPLKTGQLVGKLGRKVMGGELDLGQLMGQFQHGFGGAVKHGPKSTGAKADVKPAKDVVLEVEEASAGGAVVH